jgi:hypothetical protein
LVVLATAAGCSARATAPGPTYEVRGKVVLSDGKPLGAGRVVFIPSGDVGSEAAGEIGPGGSFALTTRADSDGAEAGSYKVRIEPGPSAPGRAAAPLPFPPRYLDEDISGLVVEVKAEPNALEPIRLK